MNSRANSSKKKHSYRNIACILLLITFVQFYYIIYYQNQHNLLTIRKSPPHKGIPPYLLNSSKCRIVNLHPFNEEAQKFHIRNPYKSCTNKPLLTYITVNENDAVLHINQSSILYYTNNTISCCYSSVKRKSNKRNPDNTIAISGCQLFQTEATLSEDYIIVKCQDSVTQKEIYKNTHAAIRMKKSLNKTSNNINSQQPLSVLIIGIDGVSRLNFIRQMPNTSWFLKENRWLEFQGYNKVADNTYPNLMAILTGMNETVADAKCKPTGAGNLDKCKLLWYDYRDLGYITAYAEDESSMTTFNYHKTGFIKPPTDYYFRPYLLASQRVLKTSKLDQRTYCTGPETFGERVLNLAKDFASAFQHHPYFGFFWMNTFSHNDLNTLSRMDGKVHDFLKDLWEKQILNNTLVLLLSDHGLRFGDIRSTRTGWFEDRLPLFFMSVPKWFEQTHPEKYNNLVTNQKRLTTPYDLHMMLQDLLVISGKSYAIQPSSACVNCKSLFEEIELDRSCEDASIEQHWCTCNGYEPISKEDSAVLAAVRYTIQAINNMVHSYKKCRKFELKNLMSVSISANPENWYKNETYLLLVLETKPTAIFESTVSIEVNGGELDFKLRGGISRLDSYARHAGCMNNYILKNFCYCKK